MLPERSPETGGGFTFQETLQKALREAAPRAPHEFVYFQPGSRGGAVHLPTGAASKAARRTVRAVRDFQDRVLGLRLVSMSTTFERSLTQHSIDLVWFTTQYAEDCGLPYVATVFDLEYLDQPWFPEVSANGEWNIRHAHHRRYLPKATRVVVPNESGREQVMRHFGLRASQILTLPHPTPELPAPLDTDEVLARLLDLSRPSFSTPPSTGRTRTTPRCSRRLGSSTRTAVGATDSSVSGRTRASAATCSRSSRDSVWKKTCGCWVSSPPRSSRVCTEERTRLCT